MLGNAAVLKVGFGLEQDLERLGLPGSLAPALDLQRVLPQLLPELGGKPTLAAGVQALLGEPLSKERSIQISDWEARPLTPPQLEYAARDATVLLAMMQRIQALDALAAAVRTMHQALTVPKSRNYAFSSRQSGASSLTAAPAAAAAPSSAQRVSCHLKKRRRRRRRRRR